LKQETQSLCCCLLLVSEDNHQLFCQVVGDRVLEEEISFSLTFGRLGQVVEDKKSITLEDISEEEHKQLSTMLGAEVTSMLCVPVISRATAQVVALACAFNKLSGDRYTEADEHKIQHCFCYTSTVLTSTLAFQKEQKLKCECQVSARGAAPRHEHACAGPMLHPELLARGHRWGHELGPPLPATVAPHSTSRWWHGDTDGDTSWDPRFSVVPPLSTPSCWHRDTERDMSWHPSCQRGGPTLHLRVVARGHGQGQGHELGRPLPARCPHAPPGAAATGTPHGSRLSGAGAAQGTPWGHLGDPLGTPWGPGHSARHRRWLPQVSDDEYTKLLSEGIQPVSTIDPNFASFTYTPRSLPEDDTSMAILSMLQDMNFINNYKMDRQTLTRFCLMVKKGYRDPPYHNWMHAFSVSHFCYLLYKNLELVNYLEDIEIFALFISCMCHDLDHRGTNNSFQVASKSVLAALYSSEGSVMERHHFAQAIAILNSQGCNIFDHFSRKDYQRMLDLMRDIILATDLAHHLRIFKDLQKMAEVGYDAKNKQHRSLLLCLLMTSCDLSDQTKGWKTTRKIA
ncbi:PDE2A phosphodiesterase, partial [Steatornis caripensis]|nr:PDE2A phosphodiesterase [Steatornis caripensis]